MNMKKILLLISLFISLHTYAETKTSQTGAVNFNTASSWSPSGVPQSGDDIVIPNGSFLTIDATATVKSMNLQSGGFVFVNNPLTISGASSSNSEIAGNLTVSANVTFSDSNLTNSGSMSVDAGKQVIFSSNSSTISNTGTITLNSDSSNFSSLLYQGSNYSGSGTVQYSRYISAEGTTWELIGSPVSGETASDIIAQTNLANQGSDFGIGTYDNTTGTSGSWSTFSNVDAAVEGTLESGKGFQMATDNGATINFIGNLVTGVTDFAISEGDSDGDAPSATGSRFNLLSNPYTSYMSVNSNAATASSFGSDYILKASNLNILHTNNQALYVYNGTDYTVINSATSAANAVIAPGQGFMVGGKYDDGSNNLSMNTAMKTEDGSDDGVSGDIMDNDRGELFLSINQNEVSSKTEIYFLENTSDLFEPSYDAGTLSIVFTGIYSRIINGDEGVDLSIQSLAYSEMWDKVIPLGINALGGEEMTIGISHRTTPADLNIYLEDTEEGTMTNLLDGDFVYTPTSDLEGVGRFFIHMSADTMSSGEVSTSMLNAYKEIDASYITIEGLATQTNETNVSLYNILGRKVLSTTLNNNMGTQTISTVGLSAGIYVIELESGTDRLSKKLLIQ